MPFGFRIIIEITVFLTVWFLTYLLIMFSCFLAQVQKIDSGLFLISWLLLTIIFYISTLVGRGILHDID